MEEYTQITLDQWTQWKEDIRRKLAETAGNFVHIGYRLKQIRDSGMYDGAADVFEFAKNEYGLGKSTVSRFIAINEKYSEGGNSLELKEEFRGFSSSKLAEMLTLPDSEVQLITEKTTIREIRDLKSFNSEAAEAAQAEEPEAAQAEEPVPAAGTVMESERSPLEKCLIDFFKDKKEMLNGVMEHLAAEPPEYKQAAERMAPAGQASHRKGIVFLFLYDWNTGIKYKLMTKPEPAAMSWAELLNMVYQIFAPDGQQDAWGSFYGEQGEPAEEPQKEPQEAPQKQEPQKEPRETPQKEPPKKPENGPAEKAVPAQSNQGLAGSVATSQQEAETAPTETASREETAQEIPKPEEEESGKAVREMQAENGGEEAPGEEAGEQILGQDCVMNHPEYMSRAMQQKEAEKLARKVRLEFGEWTGKEMPQKNLRTAKEDTEKLIALINEMLKEEEV